MIETLNVIWGFGIGWVCGNTFWDNTQQTSQRVMAIATLALWMYLVFTKQFMYI